MGAAAAAGTAAGAAPTAVGGGATGNVLALGPGYRPVMLSRSTTFTTPNINPTPGQNLIYQPTYNTGGDPLSKRAFYPNRYQTDLLKNQQSYYWP